MSNSRTLARRCAVQALYQWQLSGTDPLEIGRQFLEELAAANALLSRFRAGGGLTLPEQDRLEELLEKYGRFRTEKAGLPEPESLEDWVSQCFPPEIHTGYFREILRELPGHLGEIDAAIEEFSDRPVAEIDPVERAILRLGAYELLLKPELPFRVAVTEGIDLAKQFGASQSHKFINGLLDRIARKHRAPEIGRRSRP